MIPKRRTSRGHLLSWTPDLPDQRDYKYPASIAPIPNKIDLRSQMPAVVDQGQYESCTANAISGAFGFLELKDIAANAVTNHEFAGTVYQPASRMFIWYNARVPIGMQSYNSGSFLRDGIKSLNKNGVCSEVTLDYSDQNAYQKPSALCYQQALSHKITSYFRLQTLSDMQQCLISGFPFVVGISIYESFESMSVWQTGIVPMPQANETLLGGHSVVCVGFDMTQNVFIIRNSWGTDFGDAGYFYLPFNYLNSNLASDFWTIRK